MSNNIVAHLLDGRVVKGTSLDLDPAKPLCHVRPGGAPAVEIRLAEAKALFFVRSFEGDAAHRERHEVASDDPRLRGSTVVRITFHDGETLTGLTNRYPPIRDFFFVLPVDPASNNIRILVNRAAMKTLEPLPAR
jgi:hypothetical protein